MTLFYPLPPPPPAPARPLALMYTISALSWGTRDAPGPLCSAEVLASTHACCHDWWLVVQHATDAHRTDVSHVTSAPKTELTHQS